MIRAALLALLALACACGADRQHEAGSGWPSYTFRGRLADVHGLRIRIDPTDAPLAAADIRAAIERALAVWQATGVVDFAVAADAANAADATLSFRRGAHGRCEAFGPSTAVAHTGPTGPDNYVHFDAARPWTRDSLFRAALHELGHVLGLGHTEDPTCVMSSGVVVPDRLGRGDLDGLHSLYGGGTDGDGDVRIEADDGRTLAVLRAGCPRNCACTVFDTDGDGADELLVWRTDTAGHGALVIHRFGAGAQPIATTGPFLGISLPGMRIACTTTPAGERLLLGQLPQRIAVVAFDHHGVPQGHAGIAAAEALFAAASAAALLAAGGDLDGDGHVERVRVARR